MTDLIERIGPYLGIAAFLGLAILAFLIFQQAREVRRLREWAGRAPERADEAHDAEVATAEAQGDAPPEREEPPEDPGDARPRDRPRRGAVRRLSGRSSTAARRSTRATSSS